MSIPDDSVYILKKVKGKRYLNLIPKYRYQGASGLMEKVSVVSGWTFRLTLEVFRTTSPSDDVVTLKQNTYYYNHEGGLSEYPFPDLENGTGFTTGGVEGTDYLTVSDYDWKVTASRKIYNPETDITKWQVYLVGRHQYMRHETYIHRNIE